MPAYPTTYSKNEFIHYLNKNNVSDSVIDNFQKLPETLTTKNSTYKLNIVSTWYNVNSTYYNFEMNYYSEELIEYLFSSKVFTDVEKSINYLYCELINTKFVSK
jgi:hypothetical protein